MSRQDDIVVAMETYMDAKHPNWRKNKKLKKLATWYGFSRWSAENQHSTEHTSFIAEVDHFRAQAAPTPNLAQNIFDKYIDPNADDTINIAKAKKNVLIAHFGPGPAIAGPLNAIFDDAAVEVTRLLSENAVRNYVDNYVLRP